MLFKGYENLKKFHVTTTDIFGAKEKKVQIFVTEISPLFLNGLNDPEFIPKPLRDCYDCSVVETGGNNWIQGCTRHFLADTIVDIIKKTVSHLCMCSTAK